MTVYVVSTGAFATNLAHADTATIEQTGSSVDIVDGGLEIVSVGEAGTAGLLVHDEKRDDPGLATAADFGYFAQDADGTRCPIGAHVRRSHPRDSLDPSPGTDRSIALDKHHRLLRRGRKYGSMLSAEEALAASPGESDQRGLHFICLCASIERQYEFVQRTWVNSTKFDGLYDNADPLVSGGTRTFTVQAEPVRKRYLELPPFVRTRGGGYFFLPGVRALRYLASVAKDSK